jgi:serine/threonine protein kinase
VPRLRGALTASGRDIKPENILLRNADNISDLVIVDFGLAVRVRAIRTIARG